MKLIATDLDGTLLNSKHKISKENILAILDAQRNGVSVVASTGRMFADAKEILKEAGIDVPYIISANGSMIHKINGEKLHSFPLNKETLKKILPFLHYNNYFYGLFGNNKYFEPYDSRHRIISDFYTAKLKKDIPEEDLDTLLDFFYEKKSYEIINFKDLDDFLSSDCELFNLVTVSFDLHKLNLGKKAFRDIPGISIFSSNINNFEIIDENCSKGNAVELLTDIMGISLDDTMTIGDNFNDVSMLEKSKISVAMGNAHDDIKKLASFVTLDNNESGVAHAIRAHLK